ncbi:hypothetical protein K8R33_00450 [archaeon]|nr:hypothetical protein [archaeon]
MNLDSTTERKGVQRSSIEKVWNLVLKENNAVTPSNIAERVKLQVPTVRSCLVFLKEMDKVEIISNGKTWLVRKKEDATN